MSRQWRKEQRASQTKLGRAGVSRWSSSRWDRTLSISLMNKDVTVHTIYVYRYDMIADCQYIKQQKNIKKVCLFTETLFVFVEEVLSMFCLNTWLPPRLHREFGLVLIAGQNQPVCVASWYDHWLFEITQPLVNGASRRNRIEAKK